VTVSRILQSLLVSHTQRYYKHYHSGGHVWQDRFKSPVIQNDEHLLTVLRYIEAKPLRARLFERAENYPAATYGLGEPNELLDRLVTYEELSPYPKVCQRKWTERFISPWIATHLSPSAVRPPAACRTAIKRGSSGWRRNSISTSPSAPPRPSQNSYTETTTIVLPRFHCLRQETHRRLPDQH
jgi:putative transposase